MPNPSPDDPRYLERAIAKNHDILAPADLFLIQEKLRAGSSPEDILLLIEARRQQLSESKYPLLKVLQEVPWHRLTADLPAAVRRFTAPPGSSGYPTTFDVADAPYVMALEQALDILGYFSPSHFRELNGYRYGLIHQAIRRGIAQEQARELISSYRRAETLGALPITLESSYRTESGYRILVCLSNLLKERDLILQPRTETKAPRDNPDYVASNPLSIGMSPPHLIVKSLNTDLFLIAAGKDQPELVLVKRPEQLASSLSLCQAGQHLYALAIVYNSHTFELRLWDLNQPGNSPVFKVGDLSDPIDAQCFVDGDTVRLALLTQDALQIIDPLHGTQFSILPPDAVCSAEPCPSIFKLMQAADGVSAYLADTCFLTRLKLEPGTRPQTVQILREPPRFAHPPGFGIRDLVTLEKGSQKILSVLSYDNVIRFLDPQRLTEIWEPMKVSNDQTVARCLMPSVLGFDLVVGRLFQQRDSELLGVCLEPRTVVPIPGLRRDVIATSRFGTDGLMVHYSGAEPTILSSSEAPKFTFPCEGVHLEQCVLI